MHMPRQQRHDRRFRHKRETFRRQRAQERRAVAEGEQNNFSRATCLHKRGSHSARSLREVAFSGQGRAEVGERLNRAEEPAEIFLLYCHAFCGGEPQSNLRVTRCEWKELEQVC